MSSTSGRGRGCTAAHIIAEGTPAEIAAAPDSITGQYLTGERSIPIPRERRKGNGKKRRGARGDRQQPAQRDGDVSARDLHLRHRGVGRRQVDADHRDPVQDRLDAAERGAADAGALRDDRGARVPRQGHRHRPVADRADAAVQPGDLHRRVRADPRLVRRAAGVQGARLQAGAVLASTSRAGAARPARATGSSRSRCTSCPTSTSPARPARASATTARRWKSCSRARASPTFST